MTKNNYKIGGSFPTIGILFALLAYFQYGHSVSAALSVLLISICLGMACIVSFIPVVGWLIYIPILNLIMTKLMIWTALSSSWVTIWLKYIWIVSGVLCSILTTILLLVFVIKAMND